MAHYECQGFKGRSLLTLLTLSRIQVCSTLGVTCQHVCSLDKRSLADCACIPLSLKPWTCSSVWECTDASMMHMHGISILLVFESGWKQIGCNCCILPPASYEHRALPSIEQHMLAAALTGKKLMDECNTLRLEPMTCMHMCRK